jgi:hypothetical protein
MIKICKTCGQDFEGELWMKQCLNCYKSFKGMPRIEVLTPHKGVYIHAHPDVTKEEIDRFILHTFGNVNCPSNWGAVEVKDNRKLWYNCQNDD